MSVVDLQQPPEAVRRLNLYDGASGVEALLMTEVRNRPLFAGMRQTLKAPLLK